MSKSTLSALKGAINMEKKAVADAESKLTSLGKQLLSYVNDEVGNSAADSIKSIGKGFSYNLDEGYKGADKLVYALENGYSSIDTHISNAEAIVARAKAVKKELGSL